MRTSASILHWADGQVPVTVGRRPLARPDAGAADRIRFSFLHVVWIITNDAIASYDDYQKLRKVAADAYEDCERARLAVKNFRPAAPKVSGAQW
jgi:hypothetical protein